ncbi:unnamed protein product [Parascedosporium putredinis]|uniref:Ribosomal eL28/Mak16 domain-containing protein n=1 Tax=Parascedosporium putredinis TaxID=1442378 RepID=A0A9P1GW85_9PEZI|nr:unnamed protein product [Parascedosporium putredinis]CAI7988561.1 unnamed protein product [Parascedosporium putredinis]
MSSNVSADLIWEVVRNQNKYLVKRKTNGSPQFSRDPLTSRTSTRARLGNLLTMGFAMIAIGVSGSGKRGVTIVSKNSKNSSKPSTSYTSTAVGDARSNRKAYKSAAALSSKRGYRVDLREAAVQRVSAVRRSQLPVKADPEQKLRERRRSRPSLRKASADQNGKLLALGIFVNLAIEMLFLGSSYDHIGWLADKVLKIFQFEAFACSIEKIRRFIG